MKGLIFSEPMVRTWLEGRKTVTRRLMNPQIPVGFEEPTPLPFSGEWTVTENCPPTL